MCCDNNTALYEINEKDRLLIHADTQGCDKF